MEKLLVSYGVEFTDSLSDKLIKLLEASYQKGYHDGRRDEEEKVSGRYQYERKTPSFSYGDISDKIRYLKV